MAIIHAFPGAAGERPHGGGEPPHNDGMQARVEKLEQLAERTDARLARLEHELVRVENSIKVELHKEISASTRWVVGWVTGVGVALVAAVYFIARHAPGG